MSNTSSRWWDQYERDCAAREQRTAEYVSELKRLAEAEYISELERDDAYWESEYKLTPEASGSIEFTLLSLQDRHREAGIERMAVQYFERRAGKRLYQRPFSQMSIIPGG